MKNQRGISFILCLLILLSVSAEGAEDQPIDTLRTGVEEGLRVLKDPTFDDRSMKDEQRRQLWEIVQRLFDFRVFSKLVLSKKWEEFDSNQQESFIRTFGEFLGRFYLGKMQEAYSGETVRYIKQQLKSENLAVVHIGVYWRGREIPAEIRMVKRAGGWKVYDLQVLGISAVSNYRVQLGSILKKETPEQVVQRLKHKIKQIEKQEKTG